MILYNQNIWGNTDNPVGNRHTKIRGMVDELVPDVICMQECNPWLSRVGDFPMQEVLLPEYLEVLPEKAGENFTPIFYRKDTLELVEGGWFPFEGKNDEGSKSVTWAVFKEKATGKKFGMFSTHFWFMAKDETDAQQRRENAQALCAVAKQIKDKYNIPVIATGDLNSAVETGQTMAGYEEMIAQGMKDVRYLAKETTEKLTLHEYPKHDGNGNFISYEENYCTLDYVFAYNEDMIELESFDVLDHEEAMLSSDHCPLVVEFYLK